MKKLSTVTMIVFYLSERDLSNAPTLGDMGRDLGLPVGTAIGERVREARTQGWTILCHVIGEGQNRRFTYWMPPKDRRRAKALIAAYLKKQMKEAA